MRAGERSASTEQFGSSLGYLHLASEQGDGVEARELPTIKVKVGELFKLIIFVVFSV